MNTARSTNLRLIFLLFLTMMSTAMLASAKTHVGFAITPGSTDNFITTWRFNPDYALNAEQIVIPTIPGETYLYDVYWEYDNGGFTQSGTATGVTGDFTLSVPFFGETTIRIEISGQFPRIGLERSLQVNPVDNMFNHEALTLLSIEQWGTIVWSSMERAFYKTEQMQLNATDAPDLSNVTSLKEMFFGAETMNAPVNHWDVSTITNMHGMFRDCLLFNQPLSNWDVRKVTNMSRMFFWGTEFNQPLSSWDVSAVKDMSYMFGLARKFNQDISSWEVGQVENMMQMFHEAFEFNQNIGGWDVSRVMNMTQMFHRASVFNQNIGGWDVSSVTNMHRMFGEATAFNQNIADWNISQVTNMREMLDFSGLSLSQYDAILIGWATKSSLQSGVALSATDLTFCSGAEARQKLIDEHGWIISGDTPACASMLIFVKAAVGKTLVILAEDSDSIQQLKQKIKDKEGIPVDQQQLFFGAVELVNGRTLADYTIQNGNTLDLIATVSNNAPTVANPIPDQNTTEDVVFNFQFAANTFADTNPGDVLTYSARLGGGGALPIWLSFDAGTRTFSGTPGNDDTGSITIEVIANDGNGGAISDSFELSIQGVNDAPVISAPLTISVFEDESEALTGISFADPDAGSSPVTVTVNVGSGTLSAIPGNDVTVGGTSNSLILEGSLSDINAFVSNGELTFTTALNATSDVNLNISISDNGNTGSGGALTDEADLTVSVTAVNDAPLAVDDSYDVNEDTPQTGNVLTNDSDIEGNALTASLVTAPVNGTVVLNADGSFTYTPNANFSGPDSLIYQVCDNGTPSLCDTATVTFDVVAAVNNPPVVSNTVGNVFWTEGNPPTLIKSSIGVSDPDGDNITKATITNLLFVAGDVLSVASPGPYSIDYNTNTGVLILTGTGTAAEMQAALRTVGFRNSTDDPGLGNTRNTRIVSIFVEDENGATSEAVDNPGIFVSSINDAPVISVPLTISVFEDEPEALTGISFADPDAGSSPVTVTFNVGSGTLSAIPGNGVTVGGNSNSLILEGSLSDINAFISNGELTFTTVLNTTSDVNLNISISDNGNTGSGGALTDQTDVTLSVTAVNDAPVNTVPGTQQTNQDAAVVFSSGNGNLISVSDVDAGASSVRVTLTATNGTLTLSGTAGLVFTTGDGTSDPSMVMGGSISDINNALNGLIFSPTPSYSGAAAVQISTNDLGNTGSGGSLTDTDEVQITVNSINPFVTGVSSTTANGTYGVDSPIIVAVTFNQNILVNTAGGAPKLLLETGSTDREATYSSGSGTETLLFTYTVVAGDASFDLDYQSTSALSLNGATLRNIPGDDAILTLPSPGTAGSLGANKALVIDAVPPSGYSVTIDQDPILTTNQNAISFTFTGAEIGTTYNYTFTSSGGGANVSGSGTIAFATDQITGIDLSSLNAGTVTLSVTLQDPYGNTGTAVTDTNTKLAPITAQISAQSNVLCNGGSDGSLTVQVDGGIANYTYSWSNGSSTSNSSSATNTISSLSVGNYSVTVTDGNGQVATALATISEPGIASVSTTAASVITSSSAELGGTVAYSDSNCENESGIVYSTTPNPTLSDTKVVMAVTGSSFGEEVTGLQVNTIYYVRAFSTNDNGITSYGSEINFTTSTKILTVTPDAGQSKVFGTTDPTFTYTATGFENGDDESILSGVLTREAGETVGAYAIGLGSLSAGANYTINFIGADFAIIPADITGVTFDDASFVYDGTAKSLAIGGTLPVGAGVSYTDNSRTDVGMQEVTATITGSNFTTLVLTADLTVTPADITGISFDDASFVFDGTAKSLAITGTLPAGANVAYTDNSRTDVGTQEVTATITGSDFTTLVLTADLTVTPADVSGITFEDASFVFDGTAKSLAISGTLPNGTSVVYMDNNRADVGTQEVTATITGSNFTTLVLTADLTVTPADITGISFDDASFVFDGTAKSLAIGGNLPAGASVAYTNNNRTDVGSQEATATITGSNFTTLVLTADLTVTPATVTGITFEDASFVFDGTAKSLAIDGSLPSGTSVAYTDNSRTDVGTQEVTATITGSNFTTLVFTADLTVTPATVTGITFEDNSFVYDGTTKSLAISGTMPAGTSVMYTDNNRTDVGTQEVTATITGSNFTTVVLTADLTVTPADITGITFEDASFVYDGTAKSLAISGTLPAGANVAYSNNSRTDVGTQEVIATISGSNYTELVLTADLEITPATITGITFEDASFVYDGTAKSLAIIGTLPNGTSVAYTDNNRTDVGTQEVTATITGSNFTTLVLTADLTITPADITGITFEDASLVYDGTAKSLAIDGSLPSGTSVAYTDNSRTDVGTQEVTATITGSNYTALVLTADLEITPATITGITFEDASFVFDGTAKSLAIAGTVPAGANVVYTDNSRTDVGTHVVTATISGSNYTELVLTANLTVTPADITGITFEDASFVYDGTAKSLAITGTLPAGTTVSYTNNTHTNAGTYNIMANIEGGNNYNDLSLTANLTIHKAPQSITFNSPGVLSRDAGTIALDVYASSDLPVNLSVDDAFIATVSGTDLMVHRLGTVRVSATQPGNANYEAAEPVYMDIRIANDVSAKVPIRVHQAVSPNGDGINEFLMIEGIGDYPDNRVTIFDKSGRVLAEIEGYNNRDKVFTGQYVIDGTYYYYLDLLDDGTWKREKGFFVVKRSSGN